MLKRERAAAAATNAGVADAASAGAADAADAAVVVQALKLERAEVLFKAIEKVIPDVRKRR